MENHDQQEQKATTESIQSTPNTETLEEIIRRIKFTAFVDRVLSGRLLVNPSLQSSGIAKRHQECSFETFKSNEKLVKDLRGIEGSIVLIGKTGSGKTHLAISIFREAKVSDARNGYFITVPELLLKIRSAFTPGSTETEEDLIKRFAGYEILVLDDLGAEKTTEWSITTLYLILDRRNREMKRTIVTTNLTLQDIENTLGARIASRLAEMRVIKLNMQDYRKNR